MNEEQEKKETEEEQDKEPSYAEAIAKLKAEYEEKLAKMKSEAKAKIEERDDIIKSLAMGETQERAPTVADIINEKRAPNMKKW